jgi:hypothetical protein
LQVAAKEVDGLCQSRNMIALTLEEYWKPECFWYKFSFTCKHCSLWVSARKAADGIFVWLLPGNKTAAVDEYLLPPYDISEAHHECIQVMSTPSEPDYKYFSTVECNSFKYFACMVIEMFIAPMVQLQFDARSCVWSKKEAYSLGLRAPLT